MPKHYHYDAYDHRNDHRERADNNDSWPDILGPYDKYGSGLYSLANHDSGDVDDADTGPTDDADDTLSATEPDDWPAILGPYDTYGSGAYDNDLSDHDALD